MSPLFRHAARAAALVALALAFFHPAHAQDREIRIGDLPTIRFGVGVMQSGQYLEADEGAFNPADSEASPGFHRVRFNLLLTMDVTDRIKATVDLGHEPNDFGAEFAPAVDFVALDLALSDALTLQLGTPVTGMFNFRGYSDGAYVQDNPLIGNSPADMVTAETGVKLLGATDAVRFDLTAATSTFFEDFGPNRGFTLIGKAATDVGESGFSVGAAGLLGTNGGQVGERPFGDIQRVGLVVGDGENYNFPGSGASARDTHMGTVPGLDVRGAHVDAQFATDDLPFLVRAWYGHLWDDFSFVDGDGDFTVASQAAGFAEEASEVDFFGGTVAVDVSESVYVAGRFTLVRNLSEWAGDENLLTRIQAGLGYRFWDYALLKAEYVRQTEEADSPGQIGADWQGALLELSVVF
ncbi:MAG: hypothetical protein ABJF88_01465 [Rhodothermales bacterium]